MSLVDEIEKDAKPFFKNAKGCHDWDHVERVYNLCLRIGKEENADMGVLKLAALLHDLARTEEQESKGKICHAEKSAKIARKILERHNVDKEKIERVVHCIETHRFRGNKIPESKEAKILFDADNLDSIGAVGVGRAFLYAGEIGAKLHNKDIDVENTDAYTKEDTAYREFVVKLRKVKERMLTKEGKRIAEERHGFMMDFFNRLDKEVDGVI